MTDILTERNAQRAAELIYKVAVEKEPHSQDGRTYSQVCWGMKREHRRSLHSKAELIHDIHDTICLMYHIDKGSVVSTCLMDLVYRNTRNSDDLTMETMAGMLDRYDFT